jgi:hypothetical protein
MVDILAEDAPNLPSPEQPITYQQAVAVISNQSALLVFKESQTSAR